MIVYLDSSVLARAYLGDEDGYDRAVELLDDSEIACVTGTWSRIEVSGALVRAVAAARGDGGDLLGLFNSDLAKGARFSIISAAQSDVETKALELVCTYALRALDAWHLAVAKLRLPTLAAPGEPIGFASRDQAQAAVAEQLGFVRV